MAAGMLLLYTGYLKNGFLEFSDAAKYADISKNLVQGKGFGINFTFWNPEVFNKIKETVFPAYFYPPLLPLSFASFFILFGISDASVFITSAIFYILLVLFSYILAKRVFGKELISVLSALAIAANISVLDYASSGASEILFMLEIVLALLLFSLKKKWGVASGVLLLIAMYFTRPQSFIFILGVILFWLLLHFKSKRAFIYFLGVIILGIIIDRTILVALSGKYFLYSITSRGLNSFSNIGLAQSPSDMLRGGVTSGLNLMELGKKTFYNLYNFYRLLPQIASPYMWGLFVIGLFVWTKDRLQNSLKIATVFMVVLTFLVTALTIPFFRYLHPVVPLVYLFAVSTLVWIVETVVGVQWSVFAGWLKNRSPFTVHRSQAITFIATLLIIFFVVGQTLGVIFLDSRFEAKRVNKGQTPVYVRLSWLLRNITEPDDVIVTNLDTWGSWYGERKTVWFPLEPGQLEGLEEQIDAIYLTSYLMDDENYYMGEEWRDILYNPETHGNEFIAENYELKAVYEISASETYEKQEARGVLFIRKN